MNLVDRRGKNFRQFQARASWLDEDRSDALLERLRLEKKSLRNQRVKFRTWKQAFCFYLVALLLLAGAVVGVLNWMGRP